MEGRHAARGAEGLPGGCIDLEREFPIDSQTSDADKQFILAARDLLRGRSRSYRYLEIGSFLGGSLVPFLRDAACASVLSVDDRERRQPDERGVVYDYGGVTNAMMLAELRARDVPTRKLVTHDGTIETWRPGDERYDLSFIDGEHTDAGCFRDFLWTLPLATSDAMIMFHDSTVVHKAIQLITLYLRKLGMRHRFFRRSESEMSAVLLGELASLDPEPVFGSCESEAEFQELAENHLLQVQVQNRFRIVGNTKDVMLEMLPRQTRRAY